VSLHIQHRFLALTNSAYYQEKRSRPLVLCVRTHRVRLQPPGRAITNARILDDPNCKATLIVAPLALLEQWRQEIVDMTEQDSLKILIYHGPSRPKHVKDVKKYDVVITTYQVGLFTEIVCYTALGYPLTTCTQTLANEWPDELADAKKKKPKKKKNPDHSFIVDDEEEDGTAPKKKRVYGPLMDMAWYRVVLDEAQYIRNARTRVSTAVTHIQSEIRFAIPRSSLLLLTIFRWCLTGTPLINGLNDAYGLLRFIQHHPFGDWDRFREMVRGANDDLAAKRVQHALAGVILRRTKNSELDGRKLIELPPRHEDWVELEFMEDERAMLVLSSLQSPVADPLLLSYSFVEARAQAVFNKLVAKSKTELSI
jgi:SNF2 family DNA or RNA helicase